jgi:uncharacterized protein
MRLLALADRPFHVDPAKLATDRGVDAVVTLGDLQPSWMETLDRLQIPKFGVYGNHDGEPYMDWFGIENLHLRRVELKPGLTIAGFEGCVDYPRGGGPKGPSYTQREAERLVKKLPHADILISHCPPRGVNDDPDDVAHVGFDALRRWVEEHRPLAVLHGHTHPQPGQIVDRVGDTRVVYVNGARTVDLVPVTPST